MGRKGKGVNHMMKQRASKKSLMKIMWALIIANAVLWMLAVAHVITQYQSTVVSLICFVAFCYLFMTARKSV